MKTVVPHEVMDLYLREIIRIVNCEDKFHILVGNYQVCSKVFDTRDEAIRYVNNSSSEVIINITLLTNELKQQENAKVNR